MLRKSIRLSVVFVLPVIAALVLTGLVFAHGSLQTSIARAFLCYLENPESPDTLPCQDVVNMSGTQPLYDWNEVNQRAGGSVANSMALLPDGHLCSAGREKYYGLDQARADWPVTILPAGGSPYTFQLAVTANHPIATFHLYVTKAGYNPNVPLKWSDIDEFATFENPTLDTVAGLQYPVYQFPVTLPSRTGRNLIFVFWERHDSLEDFYMCSDVWFGASPTPSPTAAPACGAPEWVAGLHNGGEIVSHNNKQWIAKWTNSDEPSTTGTSSAWKLQLNCTYSGASGAPLPTATFIIPPTATAGPSPTPCASCGPTNTPIPPTNTFTPMPVITNTRTATRTNTPAITNTRTRTPTRTPTGPTATRTRTPTSGPSATRTRTPTAGPSLTPTRTATPSVGACSPVTSTITAPFTFDGAGTLCWQSSNLGAYINSWNTTSVSINGVNVTNLYVASGSYPAKIGGFWYVSYNSTVAWGHFEAK